MDKINYIPRQKMLLGFCALLFLCLLIWIFFSYKFISNFPKLELQIQNGESKNLTIWKLSIQGERLIDSIQLDKSGSGKIRLELGQEEFIILRTSKNPNNYYCIIPQKGEKLYFTGKYDSLIETGHITSSSENSASVYIMEYQKLARQNLYIMDSMNRIWHDHIYQDDGDSIGKILDSNYLLIFKAQKDMGRQLIDSSKDNMASLFVFNQVCGDKPIFSFENQEDLNYINLWLARIPNDRFSQAFKDYKHLKELAEYNAKLRKMMEASEKK